MALNTGEETDLDKIAEDELARLQRQYRLMETERSNASSASKPKLRKQTQLLESLTREYDQILLDLKVSQSASNLKRDVCISNEMSDLLVEQENLMKEIASEKFQLEEMDFLLKQLEKEIIALKSNQTSEKEATERAVHNQQRVSQLENRLEVAKKRFNSVNTNNFKMRQEIDHLLQERANFNIVWAKTLNSLTGGKNMMMELVEQSTLLYDQREEWCRKLQVIRERAQGDQLEHVQEMGELQRQLDHDSKLQQFLAVKGSKRVMAELEAKEAAKKRAQRDSDIATQERHKDIFKMIQEYAAENDVERLINQFTKQDEENYALFNYVNEVNQELEALAANVSELKISLENMRTEKREREAVEQETMDTLKDGLRKQKQSTADAKQQTVESQDRLNNSMADILSLFKMMQCDAAPILKLLGTNTNVDINNVMLYLKTIERKTLDVVNCAYYAERVRKIEENRSKVKTVITTSAPTKVKMTGKDQKKGRTKANFAAERSSKI